MPKSFSTSDGRPWHLSCGPDATFFKKNWDCQNRSRGDRFDFLSVERIRHDLIITFSPLRHSRKVVPYDQKNYEDNPRSNNILFLLALFLVLVDALAGSVAHEANQKDQNALCPFSLSFGSSGGTVSLDVSSLVMESLFVLRPSIASPAVHSTRIASAGAKDPTSHATRSATL